MRDFFIYNGVNSADFGCFVANANQFDAPARDVENIDVPGRNGTLTVDNGRWLNQTLTYTVYTRGDIRNKISGLRNALTNSGYQRLEDTYNPDEFYLAKFVDAFAVDQSDRNRAAFRCVFDRKPQRFLKDGSDLIFGVDAHVFTSDGYIRNNTERDALPLLRVYGTGSFTVGTGTMTISSASTYTDIDCDLMDAYKGTTNCNGNVSGTFPKLTPGQNVVDLNGVSKIEIIPRWWRL